MGDHSAIEWTEATWNPVTGCTKVSAGCDHCYAERIVERFHGKGSFGTVVRSEDKLYLPLRWRKPRRVFVNSMSDLFHDDVPVSFIARVFAVMAQTPRHTYQLLTKRHGRMRALLNSGTFVDDVRRAQGYRCLWPLGNVWLGVSVEDQHWASVRIPALLQTSAAVRWLSCEPLLGPIDLYETTVGPLQRFPDEPNGETGRIDWVVVGGESGPRARPMQPAWAQSLRDQCTKAGVPFFFKQWGEWVHVDQMSDDVYRDVDAVHNLGQPSQPLWRVGKKRAGRVLDDRTWDEYPGAADVQS